MINQELEVTNWLKQHKQDLLETAITGFAGWGRGAVLVSFSEENQAPPRPDYILPAQLRQADYHDSHLFRILATYDPVREVIIAVLLADGVKYYRLKAYPWAE